MPKEQFTIIMLTYEREQVYKLKITSSVKGSIVIVYSFSSSSRYDYTKFVVTLLLDLFEGFNEFAESIARFTIFE